MKEKSVTDTIDMYLTGCRILREREEMENVQTKSTERFEESVSQLKDTMQSASPEKVLDIYEDGCRIIRKNGAKDSHVDRSIELAESLKKILV